MGQRQIHDCAHHACTPENHATPHDQFIAVAKRDRRSLPALMELRNRRRDYQANNTAKETAATITQLDDQRISLATQRQPYEDLLAANPLDATPPPNPWEQSIGRRR